MKNVYFPFLNAIKKIKKKTKLRKLKSMKVISKEDDLNDDEILSPLSKKIK